MKPVALLLLYINMAVFNWDETPSITNPITKFLEWKGKKEDGFFVYYDKVEQERKEFTLDKPFIVLKTGWSVKGYSVTKWGFYSNEVESLGSEKLYIYDNNKKIIKEGLWSEIKADVLQLGGKLQKCLTVLYDGEVIALALKGAGLKSFIEFSDENKGWMRQKLAMGTPWEGKTGSVEYKYPTFVVDGAISKEEGEEATAQAQVVAKYYNRDNDEEETVLWDETEEDLPF